jgi:hypothetical protein
MRRKLQQQVESWKTGPRHRSWEGPTNLERKNEYNGLGFVIDDDPILNDPKNNPNWTFDYNNRFPANTEVPGNDRYKNQSLKWLHPDSHEKYIKHLAIPEKRELLEKNGWLDNEIEYHINEDGFRYDGGSDTSFLSNQGGVLYLGCSITFGVGVSLEDTWSWKLHQRKFPDKRYMNMGLPGQGVETYYRILKSYIGIVKPDVIICTYPWANGRSELFNPNQSRWHSQFMSMVVGHMQVTMTDGHSDPDAFTRMSLYSPEPAILRAMKHHDAIRWMCQENNAKLLWLNMKQMARLVHMTRTNLHDPEHSVPEWDVGRDLMHHGVINHNAMSYKIEEELNQCLS